MTKLEQAALDGERERANAANIALYELKQKYAELEKQLSEASYQIAVATAQMGHLKARSLWQRITRAFE